MKRAIRFGLFLSLFIFLTACSPPQINVLDAWARPAAVGETSAVYFRLDNNTSLDDILLSAASDAAANTEIHRAMVEDGVMKMEPINTINVPAGEQIEFAPGGLHIMLIGLNQPLVEGEKISLTLEFSEAGIVEVQALIEQR